MAKPTLTPTSITSSIVLPSTGTHGDVLGNLVFGIYTSDNFVSGAVDQVGYVYKKLGGDVLDLEITAENVYNSYEEAVLEYSYLVNIHQAKNVLSNVLGNTTASFDQDGEITTGETLVDQKIELRFPRFDFSYARRVADGISTEAGIGGSQPEYSASFNVTASVQDYDLQTIISSSAVNDDVDFKDLVADTKVIIKKVYYKTPAAMWRFFGYYGGLNTVGNLNTYGQYSDDSTFQLIPTWQNKAQAMGFEDAIYTRLSHFSYELKNNKLRIYPQPSDPSYVEKMWVQFTIPTDTWDEEDDRRIGVKGVNNMNTLPFSNLPYEHINSIGKQWVRRFSLALCKETLGQVRSKFAALPIPGESVTLNGPALLAEGKEEQDKLREELKTVLDELTYTKLMESDAELVEGSSKIHQTIPVGIFVG